MWPNLNEQLLRMGSWQLPGEPVTGNVPDPGYGESTSKWLGLDNMYTPELGTEFQLGCMDYTGGRGSTQCSSYSVPEIRVIILVRKTVSARAVENRTGIKE